MLLKFNVLDVNDDPLPAARIRVVFTTRTGTGTSTVSAEARHGVVLEAALAADRFDAYVSAAGFADELFMFVNVGGAGWQTSNPAGGAVRQGAHLVVTTTIGTVRLAPTISVKPDAKLVDNPGALLVDDVGRPEWIYRSVWHNEETIRRLDEPIFGDLTAIEWKRFKNSPVTVPMIKHGRLIMLEFGPRSGVGSRLPRFLIGTWTPHIPLTAVPEVVVFFTPPTHKDRGYPPDSYPFQGNYPFAITPADLAKDVRQPYESILVSYLLDGYKILYQLLAAGRNPIVIMPSQPSTQWGCLDSRSGLSRLVKEIVRFLFAMKLVSSTTTPRVRVDLTGGRSTLSPRYGPPTNERIPRKFTVTLAGFSAGVDAIVNLCVNSKKADPNAYPPALFHAPPEDLMDNWREIWDVDGVDQKGWKHMVRAFHGWLDHGTKRTLRSYHSSTTFHGQAVNGLVPQANVVRQPEAPVKGVYAEEGHTADRRVTWVHFSNPALTGDVTAKGHELTLPEFGRFDAHHFVPAIAIGHAARFAPRP